MIYPEPLTLTSHLLIIIFPENPIGQKIQSLHPVLGEEKNQSCIQIRNAWFHPYHILLLRNDPQEPFSAQDTHILDEYIAYLFFDSPFFQCFL